MADPGASHAAAYFPAPTTCHLLLQMPEAWSAVYPSVFYENLLPGSGMDPQPQPDGTFLIAQPCKAKVGRHLA